MAPRGPSAKGPQMVEMPSQRMAVVRGKGAPDKVFPELFPALYGSVYTLKFALKKKGLPTFKVAPPRARYPDGLSVPKAQWTHIIGIPIPEDTTSLPQKVPNVEVKIETWEYGTVAQILHLGTYDQEYPTVERLLQFIEESGYQVAGAHEEEYLSRPDANVPRTIIRYPIRKR
ncbi:MAG: GyrI-like domain-containing protein [Chloroflexota bacterium]